jgi:hypothetical protein
MRIKNFLRIYLIVFLANILENFLLLLLFSVNIFRIEVLIGNIVFTIALTLLLYLFKLTRRE